MKQKPYLFKNYLAGEHQVLPLESGGFLLQTRTENQHGDPVWVTIRTVEKWGIGQEHSFDLSLFKSLTAE